MAKSEYGLANDADTVPTAENFASPVQYPDADGYASVPWQCDDALKPEVRAAFQARQAAADRGTTQQNSVTNDGKAFKK